MKLLTNLSEEQLSTFLTKITTVLNGNMIKDSLSFLKNEVSLTCMQPYMGFGTQCHFSIQYKGSKVIRFREVDVIQHQNGAEYETNVLAYGEGESIYYHFNNNTTLMKICEFITMNQYNEHEFMCYDGIKNADLFGISTVLDLPDDIQKHVNLYGDCGNGFIGIDDISVLESHYYELNELLDEVLMEYS